MVERPKLHPFFASGSPAPSGAMTGYYVPDRSVMERDALQAAMDAALGDFIDERIAADPERWKGLTFLSLDEGGHWIHVESIETGQMLGSIDRPTLLARARAKTCRIS